jgi:hypothetical protein
MGLLASRRSLNAARDALEKMGLSRSQQDLDRIAAHLTEELTAWNLRSASSFRRYSAQESRPRNNIAHKYENNSEIAICIGRADSIIASASDLG